MAPSKPTRNRAPRSATAARRAAQAEPRAEGEGNARPAGAPPPPTTPPPPPPSPPSSSSAPLPSAPRRRAAAADRAARRRAILAAALAEFDVNGFAKTRLEDVARRAGIAKGTLYLYFADKTALFEGLVQEMLTSVLADADALVPTFAGDTRELVDTLLELVTARIIDAPGQAVMRLMIREGMYFPDLAAFYHRAFVERGNALIRQVARRGLERGEIACDALERFPQLAVAPALLAVVWNSLFHAIAPLDVRALLAVHRDLLLRGLGWQDR